MDDLLFWAWTSAAFIGGLVNVDPSAVLAAAGAGAGMLAAPAARLAGKGVRATWRAGRWLMTTPPLSEEAQAILAKLDGMTRLSAQGHVVGDNVLVNGQGNVWVVPPGGGNGNSLDDWISPSERRQIGKKARVVLARLNAEAAELRRMAMLEALAGGTPLLNESRCPPKGGSSTAPVKVA